jgi:hypothetical protein
MSTSANVTYYDVFKDGKWVKEFSQHHYCKSINLKEKLAEFQPPEVYTIQRRYPDEDEVDHLSNPLNLKLFLEGAQFTDEDDAVAKPMLDFSEEEQTAILELARLALADGETFDNYAIDMDLSDDWLKALQEKIECRRRSKRLCNEEEA